MPRRLALRTQLEATDRQDPTTYRTQSCNHALLNRNTLLPVLRQYLYRCATSPNSPQKQRTRQSLSTCTRYWKLCAGQLWKRWFCGRLGLYNSLREFSPYFLVFWGHEDTNATSRAAFSPLEHVITREVRWASCIALLHECRQCEVQISWTLYFVIWINQC